MGNAVPVMQNFKEIVNMEDAKSLFGRAVEYFTQTRDCDYYERRGYDNESLNCHVNRLTAPLWTLILIFG